MCRTLDRFFLGPATSATRLVLDEDARLAMPPRALPTARRHDTDAANLGPRPVTRPTLVAVPGDHSPCSGTTTSARPH